MPPVPDAAIAALEDAIGSGRVSVARIDESVRRILGAKARLGLDRAKLVDVAKLNESFGRPEFEAQAQEMADRGVTLLRDSARLLPLDATRPLRVLLVALSADPDACPGETIEPEIRSRVDSLAVLRADTRFRSVTELKLPTPGDVRRGDCGAFRARGGPQGQRRISRGSARVCEPTARNRQAGRGRVVRQPVFDRALSERENVARDVFDERRVAASRRASAIRANGDLGANSGDGSRDGAARRWAARRCKSDDDWARGGGDVGPAEACLRVARSRGGGRSVSRRRARGRIGRAGRGPSVWGADVWRKSAARGCGDDLRRGVVDEADCDDDRGDDAFRAGAARSGCAGGAIFAGICGGERGRSGCGVARARYGADALAA